LLVDKGATRVHAIITHGILSGNAVHRLAQSKIDEIIVSNTVPQHDHMKILGDKLRVFDVAPIFAEAIRRIHHGESVSYLFEPVDI
jgi:ribose-phosphate pyrophosphokinase